MHPVRLEGVWAHYRTGRRGDDPGPARLADVTLELVAGELCVVLGPNGAGKSTLIRVLAGVLPATEGDVRLFGDDARTLDRAAVARRVAVVTQRSEVALGFTVREVVAMGRAPYQGALLRASRDDHTAIEHTLETCQLTALADRSVSTLSGGEQKRVHIARALAQQAPVLLLDEAGAHLDIRHSVALYELIRREVTERELACLAVMHDLNAAAQHADRIILLKDGRLLADGSVDEVMTATRLSEAFEAKIAVGVDDRIGCRYFLPTAASAPP